MEKKYHNMSEENEKRLKGYKFKYINKGML